MGYLESITTPRDLRDLSTDQLTALADEIRDLMIRTVATNTGHLGPNLGVVELTLAMHRVFDSPHDKVSSTPGTSPTCTSSSQGVPEPSTPCARRAASAATRAGRSPSTTWSRTRTPRRRCPTPTAWPSFRIRGEDRHVVAVIGDGALTGGMAWEALNNIAIAHDSRLVIVVNDNERSYTPTIGGLATALTSLRTNPRYEAVLEQVKRRLNAVPGVGPAAYDALHAMKKGMKDALAPQASSRTSA